MARLAGVALAADGVQHWRPNAEAVAWARGAQLCMGPSAPHSPAHPAASRRPCLRSNTSSTSMARRRTAARRRLLSPLCLLCPRHSARSRWPQLRTLYHSGAPAAPIQQQATQQCQRRKQEQRRAALRRLPARPWCGMHRRPAAAAHCRVQCRPRCPRRPSAPACTCGHRAESWAAVGRYTAWTI